MQKAKFVYNVSIENEWMGHRQCGPAGVVGHIAIVEVSLEIAEHFGDPTHEAPHEKEHSP